MNVWQKLWRWLTVAPSEGAVEHQPEYPQVVVVDDELASEDARATAMLTWMRDSGRDYAHLVEGLCPDGEPHAPHVNDDNPNFPYLCPGRAVSGYSTPPNFPTTKGGENVHGDRRGHTDERNTMTSTISTDRFASYFTTVDGESIFNLNGFTPLSTAKNEARALGFEGSSEIDERNDLVKVTISGNGVEVSATEESARQAWAKALGRLYDAVVEANKTPEPEALAQTRAAVDEVEPDFDDMTLSEVIAAAEDALNTIERQLGVLRKAVATARRNY